MKSWHLNIILAVAIIVLLNLYWGTVKDSKRVAQSIANITTEATIWRDKYNRSHGEIEQLRFSNKELREMMPILIDSIKKDFTRVKPKTITKVVTIETEVRDTIYVSNPLDFHYKDKWSEYNLKDSVFTASVRDSIAMVDSKKKYGFLNMKSKYTIEALSYNPKVTISGIRSIDIVPDRSRWGAGLMVGYGVSKDGFSPFLGAGIYYSLFP